MVHLGVLIQSAEIHEQLFEIVLGNPTSRVLHPDLKVDVALHASVRKTIGRIFLKSLAAHLDTFIIRYGPFASISLEYSLFVEVKVLICLLSSFHSLFILQDCLDFDSSFIRCELDSVGEEIEKNLEVAMRIAK